MNAKLCLFLATATLLGVGTGSESTAAPLSQGMPARIMAVGDSITVGKNGRIGGYRQSLQTLLQENGYPVTFVGKEDDGKPANATGFSAGMSNPNHEGYGGFRIDEILGGGTQEGHTALPFAQTLAAYHPDIVLMMLGTNDVLQRRGTSSMGERMKTLVGTLFAAGKKTRLILASLTPLADRERDAAASTYNAVLVELVAQQKALDHPILLADMHAALDPSRDLDDGVHPTRGGYDKMAAVWYQALTGEPVPQGPRRVAAAIPASNEEVAALSFSRAVPDHVASPLCLGFAFTTGNAPVTVTALGYVNDGGTGDHATHEVAIYEASSKKRVTPVVAVTTAGGNLSGENPTFVYVKLNAPVRLAPDTAYAIVGTELGNGFLRAPADVSCAGIKESSAHAVYALGGGGIVFPDQTYAPNDPANLGPNFLLLKAP